VLEAAVEDIREGLKKRDNGHVFPIYWASASRRSTEAGARLADGVILSGWIVADMLTESMGQMHRGASERPQGPPIPIFNTALSVDADSASALNQAKPYVARALARPSSAKVPGWSAQHVDRFRAAYDFSHHFKAEQALQDLVPDAMVTKKAVAGTPSECTRLLQTIIDSGFKKVAIIPVGDIDAALEALAREIAPAVTGRSM
jgi:alkanesulfonate monooxygenase SsuD/methylene tetrahydromethanopterin reductase-like flavin-dependent oxidoreductase (luciferase family)